MICTCGGLTVERFVTRNKRVVGSYEKCKACGRIEWIKKPDNTALLRVEVIAHLDMIEAQGFEVIVI